MRFLLLLRLLGLLRPLCCSSVSMDAWPHSIVEVTHITLRRILKIAPIYPRRTRNQVQGRPLNGRPQLQNDLLFDD